MCILIFFNLITHDGKNTLSIELRHACLLLDWYIASLCMSLTMLKIMSFTLFRHLTDRGVWASLQLEDLACEKEER